MKKRIIKINNVDGNPEYSKGYAVLFTLVVISIISMISMGLANTALKQIILSGVARDSTTAFYEADLGSECVMYADNNDLFPSYGNPEVGFNCGGDSYVMNTTSDSGLTSTYTMFPDSTLSTSGNKCFRANITKESPDDFVETTIIIDGYNICNMTNMRTVQRSLLIKY